MTERTPVAYSPNIGMIESKYKQQPREYPLQPGHNTVELEGGFYNNHLGFKGSTLCMWVTATIGKPVQKYDLYVAMTGETLPPMIDKDGKEGMWGYNGSAVTSDGSYVLHVYHAY